MKVLTKSEFVERFKADRKKKDRKLESDIGAINTCRKNRITKACRKRNQMY